VKLVKLEDACLATKAAVSVLAILSLVLAPLKSLFSGVRCVANAVKGVRAVYDDDYLHYRTSFLEIWKSCGIRLTQHLQVRQNSTVDRSGLKDPKTGGGFLRWFDMMRN
jgi:hypothetical protein